MTALESRFEYARPNLNSSRSRLIRDILENAEDTYFLSARALAKRYDIDKATVVRSIQILGYKKYAEFAADLRRAMLASYGGCIAAFPRQRVPTFGITDSDKTPIARFCDSCWIASIANPSFHGSYVAPVAAIDALFVACGTRNRNSLAALQQKDEDSRSRWYSPITEQEGP
jgi:DNA-binding MurR/RpiR family transcriptional regulator